MGKGTKVVAHEGTGTGTGIFYKCGYGKGHYSTLPIGYPLPSLHITFKLDPNIKELHETSPPPIRNTDTVVLGLPKSHHLSLPPPLSFFFTCTNLIFVYNNDWR